METKNAVVVEKPVPEPASEPKPAVKTEPTPVEEVRVEHGREIAAGHYLDLVNNEIIPDGKYIHPVTRLVIDVPKGAQYNRFRGHLVDGKGYPIRSKVDGE